ncbi:MAG: glycosyltransferase family 2 protein [Acidobacteriota bacterium]
MNLLSRAWGAVRRRRPRLLALLAFRDEMRFLPDYFENLRSLVDGIVALDDGSIDGSAEFVAAQPEVLRLLRSPRSPDHSWDDAGNHRRLIEASSDFAPDWLIGVDADERLEQDFRSRAESIIAAGRRCGERAYRVEVRELWDDDQHFRVDGIWGQKSSARLFAARRDHEFHSQRLHSHWAPLNSRSQGDFPRADLFLYHLRMLTAEDRQGRRERYEALDPTRDFQEIGYSYLTDTVGLRLERIAAGREYRPLPVTKNR